MKFKRLTPISNKNINNIFENYPREIEYPMSNTFIKHLYSLFRNTSIIEDTFTTTNKITKNFRTSICTF